MASRMRVAGTVLLTATSVISEVRRPARSHAAAIRRLIDSSRALNLCSLASSPLFFVLGLDVALTMLNNDQLRIDLIAQVDLDLDHAAFPLTPGVGRRVAQAVFVPH